MTNTMIAGSAAPKGPAASVSGRTLSESTQSSSAERRRHSRHPFTATVEAFEPRSETTIHGRVADLSVGGCYVDTMSPLPNQAQIKVRITRENRSFESDATVVYSVPGMGMGLQFQKLDSRQVRQLKLWLAEAKGEPAPAEPDVPAQFVAHDASDTIAVLNRLVKELMNKGILTETMATEMLQGLV